MVTGLLQLFILIDLLEYFKSWVVIGMPPDMESESVVAIVPWARTWPHIYIHIWLLSSILCSGRGYTIYEALNVTVFVNHVPRLVTLMQCCLFYHNCIVTGDHIGLQEGQQTDNTEIFKGYMQHYGHPLWVWKITDQEHLRTKFCKGNCFSFFN